jgi:hypothetical protein
VRIIGSKAKTKRARGTTALTCCREQQLITVPDPHGDALPYPNLNCPSRKDIELSPSGLPRGGSSLQKFKDFAPPLPAMQSSRVVSLRPRFAGSAALFIPATRDHCGAL